MRTAVGLGTLVVVALAAYAYGQPRVQVCNGDEYRPMELSLLDGSIREPYRLESGECETLRPRARRVALLSERGPLADRDGRWTPLPVDLEFGARVRFDLRRAVGCRLEVRTADTDGAPVAAYLAVETPRGLRTGLADIGGAGVVDGLPCDVEVSGAASPRYGDGLPVSFVGVPRSAVAAPTVSVTLDPGACRRRVRVVDEHGPVVDVEIARSWVRKPAAVTRSDGTATFAACTSGSIRWFARAPGRPVIALADRPVDGVEEIRLPPASWARVDPPPLKPQAKISARTAAGLRLCPRGDGVECVVERAGTIVELGPDDASPLWLRPPRFGIDSDGVVETLVPAVKAAGPPVPVFGVVLDAAGRPVVGADVRGYGSGFSDLDGRFTMTADDSGWMRVALETARGRLAVGRRPTSDQVTFELPAKPGCTPFASHVDGGWVWVDQVVPGGRAWQAGARPRDRVVAADGVRLDALSDLEIRSRLEVPAGEQQVFSMLTPNGDPYFLPVDCPP